MVEIDENYDVIQAIKGMKHVKSPTIASIFKIVDDHSAMVFCWGEHEILVDVITAVGLKACYNGLSDANKAKFERMINGGYTQFIKVVNFMWEHVQ